MNKVLLFLLVTLTAIGASASEITWSYKSPAFHYGNGYSSHVLSAEQLQHNRKEELADAKRSETARIARELENTTLNKFIKNVESRIYATLSKQMVDAIPKYVFPPSFDFVKYPHKVTPISMYIFEFEHELNQQDLVDIWQNLPPRIGRAFDEDSPLRENEVVQTKEISHILQTDELCSCWEDTMQFMVFKVKQRANTNYWKKNRESA